MDAAQFAPQDANYHSDTNYLLRVRPTLTQSIFGGEQHNLALNTLYDALVI